MTGDRLAELLRDADADAPPPPSPRSGLAEHVRRRAAARATRRRSAAAAVVVVASATAASWIARAPRFNVDRVPTASTAPAAAPAVDVLEIARLQSQAAVHSAVADMLHARQARRWVAAPAAGATVQSERERAALALLDHADRLRRDLKQIDAALAAYRRTVELFPDTRWAAVARARIEQLTPGARGRFPGDSLT